MQIPALPSGLILEQHAEADSARAEAFRRARAGAEEGTLVVVERPTAPAGRRGRAWDLPEAPGMHGALILRPGLPAAECAELGPVALVALGAAIGEVVQPMAELHYRWPNDLLLDHGKAAGVWLDGAGREEAVEWLVIAWAVNTDAAPAALGHDAAALGVEGGVGTIDHGELLRSIARELLSAITSWDEAGFGSVLRKWRGRIPLEGAVRVELADDEVVEGTPVSVDDEAALVVRTEDGERVLALNAFFGLPQEAR